MNESAMATVSLPKGPLRTRRDDEQPPGGHSSAREGLKDTIEPIIVALILAFVFRAFMVEAFVIPTGSMAPTLYGAHGTLVCADCGTEFAYGLRDTADHRLASSVGPGDRAYCPSCNYPNTDLKFNDQRRNPETGDRILVLKWPFALGIDWLGPTRWDVVVFKDPSDGKTNFIKRLVGLPNEVLSIIDGDAYTVSTKNLSTEALEELEQLRHEKYMLREGLAKGRISPMSDRLRAELDQKLSIPRRPLLGQHTLWTIVYDHDHPPGSGGVNRPRWRAHRAGSSGWDVSRRQIQFVDRGIPLDFIELHGKAIQAICAYNIHQRQAPSVSDQRVRFVWTPRGDDLTLGIRLVKLGRSFLATIQSDGFVAITEAPDLVNDLPEPFLSKELDPFLRGESVQISFENVDYRVALRINGREVLATTSNLDDEAYYGPDITRLRTLRVDRGALPPRLYGLGGDFELAHLVVERDSYYYHNSRIQGLALSWAPRGGWAGAESPIFLRNDEYFMLGDNTSASKDSRLWDTMGDHLKQRGEAFQLGTVPRDQLIGKAFFVYWPSPHRLDWLPFLRWGVVPDVGRMRWIR